MQSNFTETFFQFLGVKLVYDYKVFPALVCLSTLSTVQNEKGVDVNGASVAESKFMLASKASAIEAYAAPLLKERDDQIKALQAQVASLQHKGVGNLGAGAPAAAAPAVAADAPVADGIGDGKGKDEKQADASGSSGAVVKKSKSGAISFREANNLADALTPDNVPPKRRRRQIAPTLSDKGDSKSDSSASGSSSAATGKGSSSSSSNKKKKTKKSAVADKDEDGDDEMQPEKHDEDETEDEELQLPASKRSKGNKRKR